MSAWLKWAVLAWVLAIAAFHLVSAACGHSAYRDVYLMTALEYAKGPIDLPRPVVLGFNLNHTPTPHDFPLWQATAALVFKAFGTWFGWANLVSLVYLFSCLYPLYRLAGRYGERGRGWRTLLLFLAQPLVVMRAGLAGFDGLSLAAAVWFLFFAVRLTEEPGLKWFVPTALLGALSVVLKLPFFLLAGLAWFFLVVARLFWRGRCTSMLASRRRSCPWRT